MNNNQYSNINTTAYNAQPQTYHTYIVDGDRFLFDCSSLQNDKLITLNQPFNQPSFFTMPHVIDGITVSDILYQVAGLCRLNHDFKVDDVKTDKESQKESVSLSAIKSVEFAMTIEVATKLGILEKNTAKIYRDRTDNEYKLVSFQSFMSVVQPSILNQLSQGIQRLNFHSNHQFCCKCGTDTIPHEVFSAVVCTNKNCGHRQYTQIQPCIITAITRRHPTHHTTQILLANHHRYGDKENKNMMYGLIAGFVEVGENLEHAVHREVAEEVDLKVENIRYVCSQPWPYPSNLMVGFVTDYVSGEINIQEDELTHADFFDIDNLPKIPAHGTIARTLIEHVICNAEF